MLAESSRTSGRPALELDERGNFRFLDLAKDGEHCTECREAQFHHYRTSCRQEVDIVLVGLGFLPISQHIKLRQPQQHCQRQNSRRKLTA